LSNVIAISGGLQYSLVLTSDAKVVGWGTNNYGQLKIPANMKDIVGIAAGYANSAIALNNGNVVTFGAKEFGALATRTPTKVPGASRGYRTP
jgi:alpha-tubulin suppressor-like RCC1 family protein